MSSEHIKVSVVTPFYNTAAYLEQCIESVLNQTHRNFEYILLDNMSDDGSSEIAARYAARDPRIRLVRNARFLTQVQNYNEALSLIAADSKYCKIVQADDWMFPVCLAEMIDVFERHPSVGLVSAYTLLERNVYLTGLAYPSTFLPGREIMRRFLKDGVFVFGSPTAVMMRSDLVRARKPFYDEASVVEDVDVCCDILRSADFGFVHQVLTFTRRDNESIMTTLRNYDLLTLTMVMMTRKFGPGVLEPDELARCLARAERSEYEALARGFFKRLPASFWELHQQGLASTGRGIDKVRLAFAVLAELANLLLNPKQTFDALRRRLAARRLQT